MVGFAGVVFLLIVSTLGAKPNDAAAELASSGTAQLLPGKGQVANGTIRTPIRVWSASLASWAVNATTSCGLSSER